MVEMTTNLNNKNESILNNDDLNYDLESSTPININTNGTVTTNGHLTPPNLSPTSASSSPTRSTIGIC
jgi:hypothetical protein